MYLTAGVWRFHFWFFWVLFWGFFFGGGCLFLVLFVLGFFLDVESGFDLNLPAYRLWDLRI